MAPDRVRRIAVVLMGVAAGIISACVGQNGGEDSAAVDTPSAGGDAPANVADVIGVRPGSRKPIGDAGDSACLNYDVSAENATIEGDPRTAHGKPEGQPFARYARSLCFGIAAYQVDTVFRDSTDTLRRAVWIQPELRMRNTRPDSMPNGRGMIVAMLRNAEPQGSAQLPGWGGALPAGDEAFIWFGKDANGVKYSAIILFQGTDNIRTLPPRSSAFKPHWDVLPNTDADTGSVARWDPHPHRDSMGVQFFQPVGSGWVSCRRGCCTALDLNVALK